MAIPTILFTSVTTIRSLIKTEYGVWSNLWYYGLSSAWDGSNYEGFKASIDAMAVDWRDKIVGILDDDCSFVGLEATYRNGPLEFQYSSFTAPLLSIGIHILVDPMPDVTCLIIQKRTNTAGRQNRGRIFIPGISEDMHNDGIISEADPLNETIHALTHFLSISHTWNSVVHNNRHLNKKENLLQPITQCRAMRRIGTRRDRAARTQQYPMAVG